MSNFPDLFPNPHGFSKEHLKFIRWYMCPCCKKFIMLRGLNLYKGNGEKIATSKIWENPYSQIDKLAIAECKKCYQKWNIFDNSDLHITTSNEEKKDNNLKFKDIIQSERFEESIGYEERNVDNSRSSVNSTRRFTVSREWKKTYTIDYEHSEYIDGEIGIGINSILNLKLLAEQTISSKYSLSKEEKHFYEEEIIIEIPKKTKVKILIYWKRIWQKNLILFNDKENRIIQIPFKFVTGLTFDQSQIDENN